MFRGKRLSEYASASWVTKMSEVIENEIYHESGECDTRTYAMIRASYEEIKNDFYSKMIGS